MNSRQLGSWGSNSGPAAAADRERSMGVFGPILVSVFHSALGGPAPREPGYGLLALAQESRNFEPGATDWRLEGGEAGAVFTRQRGRWASDLAEIYQRPLLGVQLRTAAAVGGARGAGLEELCAGFAQRAVRC